MLYAKHNHKIKNKCKTFNIRNIRRLPNVVKQAIFPNFVKGLTSQIGQKLAYFVSEFKRRKLENAKFGFTNWMISFFVFIDSGTISDQRKKKTA